MKYPVLIHQTNRNTVIAVCPILKYFYAEGNSVEAALKELREKFICYLHDNNIVLEIIPVNMKDTEINLKTTIEDKNNKN